MKFSGGFKYSYQNMDQKHEKSYAILNDVEMAFSVKLFSTISFGGILKYFYSDKSLFRIID